MCLQGSNRSSQYGHAKGYLQGDGRRPAQELTLVDPNDEEDNEDEARHETSRSLPTVRPRNEIARSRPQSRPPRQPAPLHSGIARWGRDGWTSVSWLLAHMVARTQATRNIRRYFAFGASSVAIPTSASSIFTDVCGSR